MHAMILAAGRALRLRNLSIQCPKGLLEIGGRTLLDYSLENLVGGGITNVTIVTGHCGGMIRDELGTSYRGVPIRYAFNPDYVNTGSVISLLVGAAYVTGPSVLVVESDLLYHPSFIEVALSEPSNTILVADRSGSGDEVYVCVTEDGYLDYLGKTATPEIRERSLGEYAGMALVSDEMLATYCRAAKRLKERRQADGHYEELLFQLSRDGHQMRVRHCPSLPWAEVDTEDDLHRAKLTVFPKLSHLWQWRADITSPAV